MDKPTYTGIGHHGQAGRPHVCNPTDGGASCFDEGVEAERARIKGIIHPCGGEGALWCADVDECGWCQHGERLLAAIGGDDA